MGDVLGIPDWAGWGAICFAHPLRFDRDVAAKFVRRVREGVPTGLTAMPVAGCSTPATTAGFTATFDSRDYVINPTRGWFNTYAVEQYIPGLSTLNLSRLQLDVNHYFPLWANHTLAAGWKLGTLFSATGGFVPPYERFFSTGSNLIRGWPENPVGAGALGQFPYGSFSGDSMVNAARSLLASTLMMSAWNSRPSLNTALMRLTPSTT